MHRLLIVAAAGLSACTVSTDFDRPFVPADGGARPDRGTADAGGAAADARPPDATPLDGGLADDGAVADGAPAPDALFDAGTADAGAGDADGPDAGSPDVGLPDAAPPEVGPQDAEPLDAALPDLGNQVCVEDDLRAVPCGPASRQAQRCVDDAWVDEGGCRAHLVYPCGAEQWLVDSEDGQWIPEARLAYRPNFAGDPRRFAVEGFAEMWCDGCQREALDGRLDLHLQRTVGVDGRVSIERTCRPSDGTCARETRYVYALEAGEISASISSTDDNQIVQRDLHRLAPADGDNGPLALVESLLDLSRGGEDARTRLTYTYAPDGWLTDVAVSGDVVAQQRRYTYSAAGAWALLEFTWAAEPDAPFSRMYFDTTCAECDADRCWPIAPDGCVSVPLRRDADGFVGGWPTIACLQGQTSQISATMACAGWQGTLALSRDPEDLRWMATLLGPQQGEAPFGVLARLGGRVDPDGVPRWHDGTAIPLALFGGNPFGGGQCVGLAPDGRLRGVNCGEGPPVASGFLPYICERRPPAPAP